MAKGLRLPRTVGSGHARSLCLPNVQQNQLLRLPSVSLSSYIYLLINLLVSESQGGCFVFSYSRPWAFCEQRYKDFLGEGGYWVSYLISIKTSKPIEAISCVREYLVMHHNLFKQSNNTSAARHRSGSHLLG